jgi:hypothetical protein
VRKCWVDRQSCKFKHAKVGSPLNEREPPPESENGREVMTEVEEERGSFKTAGVR